MDKKGTDKILAIYWFIILVIVAGGIYAMVYLFYQSPTDVRELEADVLGTRIGDCLSNGGYFRESVWKDGVFLIHNGNFLETCHLNLDAGPQWGDEEQYYVELDFYSVSDPDISLKSISTGNQNWRGYCEVQEVKEYKNLVKCVEKRFYTLDGDNNQYLIKILSVVRKTEKNVKD